MCLSGLPEDKENMEADDMLEPPLCSCRMEAPKNQNVVTLAEGKCMAVESVDGKVEHVMFQNICLWKDYKMKSLNVFRPL